MVGLEKPPQGEQMKYEALKSWKFLKVPVLNHELEKHPLSCTDSLVYGYLVYLGRRNGRASQTALSTSLRLDRRASIRSLAKLEDLQLVRSTDKGYEAVEPRDDSRCLFCFRNDAADGWHDSFVYDRVYLPEASAVLPIKANILFWHLFKLSFGIKGSTDRRMVGGNPKAIPKFLTDQYLATSLRCDPKTIRANLDRLRRLGLITTLHRSSGYVVGIQPLEAHVGLWRKKWVKEEPVFSVSLEELFSAPSSKRLDIEEDPAGPILKQLRVYGISGGIADELASTIIKNGIAANVWQAKLVSADKRNRANYAVGKSEYDHAGVLLKIMLEEVVQTNELQQAEYSDQSHRSADEVFALEALMQLNASVNATDLIRLAVRSESLQCGTFTLPCSLTWNVVQSLATKYVKDWEGFKTAINLEIFGDCKLPSKCQWLEQWEQAKQAPQEDNAPFTDIGLPRYDSGQVRHPIRMFAWDMKFVEDEESAVEWTNEVVRIAAVQSASYHPRPIRQRVDAAIDQVLTSIGSSKLDYEETDDPEEIPCERDNHVSGSVATKRAAEIGGRWLALSK